METIFTIGTTGRHDDDFIDVLKQHGVDAVIDIRLRTESPRHKFASGKHIEALCEANGIAYVHDQRFAPTAEMVRSLRGDRDGYWPRYEREFLALIRDREMLQLWQEVAGGFERPCLLCAEKTAETCHRRLLAETLVSGPATGVQHL